MNRKIHHNPVVKILCPTLLLCLAAIGCDRRDTQLPAESDTADTTSQAQTAPPVATEEPMTDQGVTDSMSDPCVGLSGTALDDCRMRQADATGTLGDAGDDMEPLDEGGMPPPVTEEPMEQEPPLNEEEPIDEEAIEDPNEVPPQQ